MTKGILLYFALLLWFVVPAQAQLTIIAPDKEAKQGEEVEMEIVVSNFDSIVGMQFSLKWDSLVLKFKQINPASLTPELSGFTTQNFNNSKPGELRTLWFSNTGFPQSIRDSSVMFSIFYEVVGQEGTQTMLEFSNSPITIEFNGKVNGRDSVLAIDTQNGSLNVLGMTSPTKDIRDAQFQLAQNEPNPFSKVTRIRFNLNLSDEVSLQIYDLTGQLLYTKKKKLGPGEHSFQVDGTVFPSSGTYLYRLATTSYGSTKKMLVIK